MNQMEKNKNNNNNNNNSSNSLVFGRWPQTKITMAGLFVLDLLKKFLEKVLVPKR